MLKPVFLAATLSLGGPVWAQNPVTVHVVDDKNAPVAGALVEVQIWVDHTKPTPALVTDAKGDAVLSLPRKPDPKVQLGRFLVAAKGFAFAGGTLSAERIEVRLERGTILRGQVLDEAGKPVVGAQVRATGAMKDRDFSTNIGIFGDAISPRYQTQGGADGRFQIADVPAKMNVGYNIQHPKYAIQGGRVVPEAEEIVRLKLGGTVHGRLLDLEGQPLAKVPVYASALEIGEGYNGGTTDEKGFFTIGSLRPGAYRVGAQMEFFGGNPQFVFSKITNLQVEAGKTTEVAEMRAVKGVEIRGIVRDAATKKPLPGAQINAWQKHDTSGSGASDATGHFSIRVLPGVHQVTVNSAPAGYIRPNQQPTADVSDAAKIAPEVVFDLQPSVVLRGVTVDEAGKPLAARLAMSWIDDEIESGADGQWQYTPSEDMNLSVRGGEDDQGYFELIDPKPIEAPFPAQIVIRMRRVPWNSLSGRVLDTMGAPVAGVKIEGTYHISLGGGTSTSRTQSALSDAQGRFRLPKMRNSRHLSLSGKKDGFAFRSGGEISATGANWTSSDLVFAALNRKIEGVTAPGARVAAAGRETLADATGRFTLEGLPAGEFATFAASKGKFGQAMATGNAPLQIELKTQGLQGVDAELGRKIWLETAQDPQHAKYYALSWLQSKANRPVADDWEAVKREAQEPPTLDHDWLLAALVKTWAPQLPAPGRVEALQSVIKGIKTPETAWMAWLHAAIATRDGALARRAVAESVPVLEARVSDFNWREWNLYRLAVAAEIAGGEAAGAAALDRAMVWTMTHHPAKSFREDGQISEGGRDEYLKIGAGIVGAGSEALLRRLLAAIDPETGYDVEALAEAIPGVAQTRGPQAALPLLDALLKMPTLSKKEGAGLRVVEPATYFGQAARRVIPLLGQKSPQQALELARRVTSDRHRARALAAAARFQTGADAAKVWRDAFAEANPEDVPRFAAQVWEIDRKLGAELFQTARTRVAAAMSERYVQRNLWPTYAFYFARVDAALARLILEREWVLSLEKKERGGAIARAMSAIDARRADEMARQLTDKDFDSPEARRKIGQYLQTSEALRRDLPFDRWGASDTWSPGDEEW